MYVGLKKIVKSMIFSYSPIKCTYWNTHPTFYLNWIKLEFAICCFACDCKGLISEIKPHWWYFAHTSNSWLIQTTTKVPFPLVYVIDMAPPETTEKTLDILSVCHKC